MPTNELRHMYFIIQDPRSYWKAISTWIVNRLRQDLTQAGNVHVVLRSYNVVPNSQFFRWSQKAWKCDCDSLNWLTNGWTRLEWNESAWRTEQTNISPMKVLAMKALLCQTNLFAQAFISKSMFSGTGYPNGYQYHKPLAYKSIIASNQWLSDSILLNVKVTPVSSSHW